MPWVLYRQANGAEYEVEVPENASVMDGAVDNGIDGIIAQCGGACICATCHCYVDPAWFDRLPAAGTTESEMLGFVLEPRETSRLACQIRVTQDLNGLIVELPARQF
ncbi:MAG: 2Fe-2S iron-sulfur cluster-binding protein [Pseudomonadales bacterium]